MYYLYRPSALPFVFRLVILNGLLYTLYCFILIFRSDTAAQNGYLLGEQGRYAEAIQQEREAVRLNPHNCIAHNNLGFYLFRVGQLPEAERECREAVRLRPDRDYVHDSLGETLTALGKTREAIAECRESIRLAPEKAVHYNSLGRALLQNGQTVEARQAWKQALLLDDPEESLEAHKMLVQTGGDTTHFAVRR